MTAFEFLSVALSFVLGLAVTLLLTSILKAFRHRNEARMDWLPFVWTGYVLLFQFQYWWAIWELGSLPQWTVLTFGLLLALAALLFLAGGLVLPSGSGAYPSDLSAYFNEHGRWAVVALAGYLAVAVVGNVILFRTPVFSSLHYLMAAEAALAVVAYRVSDRKIRVLATVFFGVATLFSLSEATTFAY